MQPLPVPCAVAYPRASLSQPPTGRAARRCFDACAKLAPRECVRRVRVVRVCVGMRGRLGILLGIALDDVLARAEQADERSPVHAQYLIIIVRNMI